MSSIIPIDFDAVCSVQTKIYKKRACMMRLLVNEFLSFSPKGFYEWISYIIGLYESTVNVLWNVHCYNVQLYIVFVYRLNTPNIPMYFKRLQTKCRIYCLKHIFCSHCVYSKRFSPFFCCLSLHS